MPNAIYHPEDPRSKFDIVYLVTIHQELKIDEATGPRSYELLNTVYVASSVDSAKEWCKDNTDFNLHSSDARWYFSVRMEAVDGTFSGIGGIVAMLDWNGKDFVQQER